MSENLQRSVPPHTSASTTPRRAPPFKPLTLPTNAQAPVLQASPTPSTRKRKTWRNGYETPPKAPSYKPYTLERSGRKRTRALVTGPARSIKPVGPLSEAKWNKLAMDANAIPVTSTLRGFQTECANLVITRSNDVVVIAPTGAGKSMLWCLPPLAVKSAVSLVVTPYRSLGQEGENNTNTLGLSAIFINEDHKSDDDLRNVAAGHFRVIFVCAEMLESPRFAQVLYSPTFRGLLQAIYVDEAHLVHESVHWRTAYGRLAGLRQVVGINVPVVAISATLPSPYRAALCNHIGLKPSYHLINLGNFRPELSIAVRVLQYGISTFQDLAFTLPTGARREDIRPTLVYCDDIDMLTDMLWWYHQRLVEFGLPTDAVEILHAGLSESHQRSALQGFRDKTISILLATEKIGAGINLPHVEHVVQYLARNNLSLAKLDQRRGRGARTKGMTAICYFLVEPELIDGDVEDLKLSIDMGILDLVQTTGCYQEVLDKWLENPPRPPPSADTVRVCCSHCHPHLTAAREYPFVMVSTLEEKVGGAQELSKKDRELVLKELQELRLTAWREEWRAQWPMFGPKTLISDSDLEAVAKVATSIRTIEDLQPITKIVYWSVFGPWLLSAVQRVLNKLHLHNVQSISEEGSAVVAEESHTTTSSNVSSRPPVTATRARASGSNPYRLMHPSEMLLDFST